MCASRWQPLPVLICSAGAAGGADTRGIVVGLLVALDNGEQLCSIQSSNGFHQQGGFAGAGTGDQIERKNSVPGKVAAVLIGIVVVLGENVALDLHHA